MVCLPRCTSNMSAMHVDEQGCPFFNACSVNFQLIAPGFGRILDRRLLGLLTPAGCAVAAAAAEQVMAWLKPANQGVEDWNSRLKANDPTLTAIHVFKARKFGHEVSHTDVILAQNLILCGQVRKGGAMHLFCAVKLNEQSLICCQ